MYQRSCLRHNVGKKDNISDKQLSLNNWTREGKQKYICSYFYWMGYVQILFVDIFVDKTGTEFFYWSTEKNVFFVLWIDFWFTYFLQVYL